MPQNSIEDLAIANAVALLSKHPDYKIVERFRPETVFAPDDGSSKGTLMIIDTETTGLDPAEDVAFEIGYVLASYSKKTGVIFNVIDTYSGTEDPGYELSDEIMSITGVDYENEVKGNKFDDAKVIADVARSDLVIAHNARFDRPMVEKRFSGFKEKPWVCSFDQGPWKEMGFGSSKLDYLLIMAGGFFHDAHRALVDSQALLRLLTLPGVGEKTVFSNILDKGRYPSYTLWANDSAFETKDILKKNGYRWSDGSEPGKFKAWHKTGVTDPDQELSFLASEVYKRPTQIHIDLIEARDSFSSRFSDRIKHDIVPVRKSLAPK